ncbi:MFS general substrate transporter [Suhomyces tanzawaensis NRRL Y-17324]|uniref:MFS general substrate transporter n=1 Tax=Suhomyces tanzawaensis NRRL Y-17324 TaxID=984487 RepID=A0A1E4SJE0_9ASCO|nr:MFS general substrate transporter [Suhomyces tanzawaensis NRRL Y-17324]ODV79552.1 MFS general substrate transporter [Suhomyces tanzawaensis NRRL Y-17324]
MSSAEESSQVGSKNEGVLSEELAEGIDYSSPSHQEISKLREAVFLFLLCLSQLITQISVGQTMGTGNYIARTFHVEGMPGEMAWFTAAFSLSVGTFILISGRLGDMYGYKTMYLIGYAWYAVWSLATGFAAFVPNRIFFQTMRSMQGIGPAIMMPNTQALIGSYFPDGTKKFVYLSLFGAVAPSGFVIGSLLSGTFAQLVWWPWTFWLSGMGSVLAAVIAFFIIPKHIGHKSYGSFDWYGSVTGVSGLILINFALNQGPNVGWDTPYVYVLLIVGVLFMGAFYLIEKRVANPLVPPDVLRGDTGFVLGCITAGWACFGVWLYYTFRWSIEVDHLSPVLAAAQISPAIITGYIAALASAYLLQTISLSYVMVISMCAFFIGCTLQATRPVGQIYWAQKFFSFLIASMGIDLSFPSACIILSQALPRHRQGIAGSLVSTFVNYSISVGIGLASAVEVYTTKNKTPSFNTTVTGMRNAFYLGMGCAGFGIVLSVIFVVIQFRAKMKKERTSGLQ